VVRHFFFALSLISCLGPLQGATLERLSLDDMIGKSSSIVRGKISGSYAAFTRDLIYTHYQVEVLERWKGTAQATEFLVPGGTVGKVHQTCEGAPQLSPNKEYLLFLWTSKAGQTFIIGFSQGIFDLTGSSGSKLMAVREAPADAVLEPGTGNVVKGERIALKLHELKSRVASNLAKGAVR
jgi:hypothetical protein